MVANPETVSVIIPIYNVEDYLRRCVESVIKQTYGNTEILLFNDGSTDSCEDICKEYAAKDSRIRHYYHSNMGLAQTRNRGIELASGEYITFLDSDDWFELEFINKILSDMVNTESEIGLCDIFYANTKNDEKTTVKMRFSHNMSSVERDKSTINKSRLFAWGKIYKKSLFLEHNIKYPCITFEDICTPLLVAKARKVSYTPEPLINHLENREGSLSSASRNIGDIGKGLLWLQKEMRDRNLYEDLYIELKKIALAQFRFAARRFGHLADDSAKRDLQALSDVVGKLFPDLRGISKKKFYVPDDAPTLRAALELCLPFDGQIVGDISKADSQPPFDESTLNYSLAELIMENL